MDETRARDLLDDERRRLTTIEDGIERDGLVPDVGAPGGADPASGQEPGDEGTTTEDRTRDLALLERVETELAEVGDALRRLDDGTYGRCARCGEPIPDERLEANPTARYHVEHEPSADVGPLH